MPKHLESTVLSMPALAHWRNCYDSILVLLSLRESILAGTRFGTGIANDLETAHPRPSCRQST